MTGEQWARVAALFDTVCERPAAERAAWLDRHAGDETTRAEVVALLHAYDRDPDFLEPAPGTDGDATAGPALRLVEALTPSLVGRRVGAYRLTAEIGRGGMGIVYAAERDDAEFDRRAAVKILPAWSAAPLAERFRFERRVLAALDHPGIAALLDAGSTEEGVPYFVMELVDGEPIDAWCRSHGTGVRERVALVERVCAAVAYAHQRLVIHRDLKAANILVTAGGTPKLLDFGIAALLDDDGVVAGGRTRTGHHSFTPEYASPEQIRGERVTTASDVYSLGVVLYRLLADRPPYDLAGLSPLDAMRVACEADPPPMSAVAAQAQRAALRGDLDRIVAKALRKVPAERYGTIAELSADLRAWQEGRPVGAAPQTLAGRLRRGIRRHRGAVAAGTALVATLVAGVVGTSWQARVAARERDRAQQRFRQVREISRAMIFDIHDALRPIAGATEARRLLLDRAVHLLDAIAADAGGDPALALELARGYYRLGSVQGLGGVDNVGDTSAARASFDKATRLLDDVRRADPSAEVPLILALDAYGNLEQLARAQGDDAAARRADATRLALLRELETRKPTTHAAIRALANGYSEVGISRAGTDLEAAGRYYASAVRLYAQLPPASFGPPEWHRPYSLTLKRLGAVEMVRGALDDSERHYRAALALEEEAQRLDPRTPRWTFETSYTLADLGLIAVRRGRFDDALALWSQARAIRLAALAADPQNDRMRSAVASIHARIGRGYLEVGRFAEAMAPLRAQLAEREALSKAPGTRQARLADEGWARADLAAALVGRAALSPDTRAADLQAARDQLRRIPVEAMSTGGNPHSLRAVVDSLALRARLPL